MQRSRPTTPPAQAAEVSTLPLSRLLELTRAPGAARREVDALLGGLSLPLPTGEDARARAELLHGILQDKQVRAFTGSDGRRVAHAAMESLEALGYPYALEVPPELLAEARSAVPRPREEKAAVEKKSSARSVSGRSGAQGFGGGLIAVPVLFVGGFSVLQAGLGIISAGALVMVFCYVLSSLTAAVLAPTESVRRTRWLHWLLILMAGLPGLVVTGLLLKSTSGMSMDDFWILLLMLPQLGLGLMQVVGSALLYGWHPDPHGVGEEEG